MDSIDWFVGKGEWGGRRGGGGVVGLRVRAIVKLGPDGSTNGVIEGKNSTCLVLATVSAANICNLGFQVSGVLADSHRLICAFSAYCRLKYACGIHSKIQTLEQSEPNNGNLFLDEKMSRPKWVLEAYVAQHSIWALNGTDLNRYKQGKLTAIPYTSS